MAYDYDVIIRSGTIYDGSGGKPYESDLALQGDRISKIEKTIHGQALLEIDASGLAVAPGFINMLSWANETLIEDGRSQGDIRQGVTLEILGEGQSMGPLNEKMKENWPLHLRDIKYDVAWTSLKEYLDFIVKKGVSPNVASFVGATTIRVNVLGEENKVPSKEELGQMKELVASAMADGALGVSTALVYAPAIYADTEEIIALAKVAHQYGGMYASHLRSEGDALLSALDEFIEVNQVSGIRSEIYHLKAAGRPNWNKIDTVLDKIEASRKSGLAISANMYMYEAANTGLDVAMPPWVQEGGINKWIERLKIPDNRKRVKAEMSSHSKEWENGYLNAGGADGIILIGFTNEKLKKYTGKKLSDIARDRGVDPEDAIMDLIIEDRSRIETVYFWMCEDNIKKQLVRPWVSIGSDGSSMAPEGVFLKSSNHPRAYGNTARFLGKYVRDFGLMPLEEAIRRLTSLPAHNLRVKQRGLLKPDYFGDVVIFDPDKVEDRATYENPHQFSVGVEHVFVNGTQVLDSGEHTGALPGRVVLGPGFRN